MRERQWQALETALERVLREVTAPGRPSGWPYFELREWTDDLADAVDDA